MANAADPALVTSSPSTSSSSTSDTGVSERCSSLTALADLRKPFILGYVKPRLGPQETLDPDGPRVRKTEF